MTREPTETHATALISQAEYERKLRKLTEEKCRLKDEILELERENRRLDVTLTDLRGKLNETEDALKEHGIAKELDDQQAATIAR